MKKVIILALITMLTAITSFEAQAINPPFSQGTIIANANIGLIPGIGANVSGEYVLVDSWWQGHFAVGGYAGYNIKTYSNTVNRHWYSCVSFMPRASYGINIIKDLEVHAGMMMGFCYRTMSWYTHDWENGDSHSSFMFELAEFTGARYRLTDFMYADAEFVYCSNFSYIGGIRPSIINLGLSFVF